MTSGLLDELETALQQRLRQELAPDPDNRLANRSAADLLITYLNWQERLITATPRAVHLSNELSASPEYRSHQAAIKKIAEDLRNGTSVTPHLSEAARVAHEGQQPAKGRRDQNLDRLLAEWGIHHLHLSTGLQPSGDLVQRTKELLFVAIKPTDAYLIAVGSHGDWTDTNLVTIAYSNWPDGGLFHKLNGIVDISPTNQKELAAHRAAGMTTMIKVGNAVLVPPGQSLAGTPLRVTDQVNVTMHGLRELSKGLQDPKRVAAILSEAGVKVSNSFSPQWTVEWRDRQLGVLDSESGAFVTVLDLPPV